MPQSTPRAEPAASGDLDHVPAPVPAPSDAVPRCADAHEDPVVRPFLVSTVPLPPLARPVDAGRGVAEACPPVAMAMAGATVPLEPATLKRASAPTARTGTLRLPTQERAREHAHVAQTTARHLFLPRPLPWRTLAGLLAMASLFGAYAFARGEAAKRRWVIPIVLSSADPRVVEVAAAVLREGARNAELAREKAALDGVVRETEDELARSAGGDRAAVTRRDRAARARADLGVTETAWNESNDLLVALRASPYAAASAGNVALAFLPKDRLGEVRVGDALVACRAGALLCRDVGVVGDRLGVETEAKRAAGDEPPIVGELLRIDVDERVAAQHGFLHVERRAR